MALLISDRAKFLGLSPSCGRIGDRSHHLNLSTVLNLIVLTVIASLLMNHHMTILDSVFVQFFRYYLGLFILIAIN